MRQDKPLLPADCQALSRLTTSYVTMIYLGKCDIEGCPDQLYVGKVWRLDRPNSAHTSSTPAMALPTTVSMPFKATSRPSWRAELIRGIHITIAPLLVELQAKRLKVPQGKIPPKLTSPPVQQPPTSIRIPWRGISEPFRCAKSSCSLCLSIPLVVLEVKAKRSQVPQVKIRPKFLHHFVQHYQPTIRTAYIVGFDQFDALNSPVTSVIP